MKAHRYWTPEVGCLVKHSNPAQCIFFLTWGDEALQHHVYTLHHSTFPCAFLQPFLLY